MIGLEREEREGDPRQLMERTGRPNRTECTGLCVLKSHTKT